jgi:hypothetical protein
MISGIRGGEGDTPERYRPGASPTTPRGTILINYEILFRSYPQSGFREFAQALGCALGGDITLRSAQHFEADHEFSDGR